MTQTFNPIDFGFEWTNDGWYKWDSKEAHKQAMNARNQAAKEAQAKGNQIRRYVCSGQLITKGGIGTGHPEIQNVVTVYCFHVFRRKVIMKSLKDELAVTLDHFASEGDTDYQSGLRDLLTDLRHIADERGLDFDRAIEGSAEVFAEESEDV